METREHLIEAFDDDAVRAEALLELGDDWRDRFDDAERAMEMYERAADGAQVPDDVYERICEVADELGDDERVYRACSTLARRAEAPETEADWFARAAEVARDRLWESERAIQAFERVLETDPSRFEAFQAITSMLTKSEDWERLEAAYRRAIELNRERDEVDEDLLAVLWFKLGDVHKLHLEQPEEAIEAYREASELFPDNPKFHEAIVDVAESELDDVEAAERHLRALYRLDPDRIEMLERLGRLHLRREEVDAALAHFRAYRALGGELEERAESLLDRVETGMYSSPEGVLDETHRRDFVYPESLDTALNDVFEIIFPVVLDWTSEFRSEYGLERDDFVDPDAKLAFNNIYRDIASDLGYEEAPDLWQSGEYRGLTKAALDDRIVVAGDDLFGSGDEKRIAFAVAKTLFLLEKPFYLLGVLDLSDLQAFFLLALQLVRSDIDFERDEAMEEAFGELERTVTGDQRERLREAIDAATDASDEVDLGRWVEAVEDAANRVGFLFAGDLDVARARLREEAQPFSERDVETRMQTLIEYSLSDDYLTLRDALGLDVS